jgi:hypothetical protein
MPVKQYNLDSKESIFFENELQYIMSETYETLYPELKYSSLLPVVSEGGSGVESIGYDMYDEVGIAKVIANYADDLPRSDVKGHRTFINVKGVASSYGYNIQEIRAAAYANKPLERMKAASARKSIEMLINKGAWKAHNTEEFPTLYGLLYHPNITAYESDHGAGSGGTVHIWSSKTADEIIFDINKLCQRSAVLTKGNEISDTFACPITQYSYISSTKASAYTETTILDRVKLSNPHITTWTWLEELKDVNPVPSTLATSAQDVAISYKNSPLKLKCEVPQPFEQFAPESRGLEFIVPCHARFAGVCIMYPLSVTILEHI